MHNVLHQHGIRGLFLGVRANLAKDVPFAMLKMGLYESLGRFYATSMGTHELTSLESGIVGTVSGAAVAVVLNPLDVVNTRIKSGSLTTSSLSVGCLKVAQHDGPSALFSGLLPRLVLISFGSTVFWYVYGQVHIFCGLPAYKF